MWMGFGLSPIARRPRPLCKLCGVGRGRCPRHGLGELRGARGGLERSAVSAGNPRVRVSARDTPNANCARSRFRVRRYVMERVTAARRASRARARARANICVMSSKQSTGSRDTLPLRARLEAWWIRARDFGAEHYGVDTRALGIFRIGLGLMLLYDLGSRSLDMTAHYTDDGFMPRQRLVGGWVSPLFYSFHNWGGNVASQAILFAVAAVFATMLLVRYRTRIAAVMSFVLLASLQGRNYLILQGGDDILRVMLFWSLFTPLAARYSVDAVLAAHAGVKAPAPPRVFSIGALALVCQLFAMYVVS